MAIEGTLMVTPAQLRSAANEFESASTQVANLTQNMLDKVTALNTAWQGDAAVAYTTKFKGLQDDILRMQNMIKEHVIDLQGMAETYDAAEKANVEATNALASDVIV
jgi:WXG100 family type VII secretion target